MDRLNRIAGSSAPAVEKLLAGNLAFKKHGLRARIGCDRLNRSESLQTNPSAMPCPSTSISRTPGTRAALRDVANAFVIVLVGCTFAACGGSSSSNSGGSSMPNAKSPETQSDAEYDVAKDLFYKGQPRAALDHARKAVELNEDNSKALYFTSVIHLSFCST